MSGKLRKPQTIASSLGMIGLGIVLFVVGTVLKSHFQVNAALCNTFGGSTAKCTGNEGAYSFGQVLQPLGGVVFAIGVVIGIVLLVDRNSKPKVSQSAAISHAAVAVDHAPSRPGPTSAPVSPPTVARQKPDAVSTTIGAVEAIANNDREAIQRSSFDIKSLLPGEVFAALGDVFSMIAPSLDSSKRNVILEELRASEGADVIRRSIEHIGGSLMIECDADAALIKMNECSAEIGDDEFLWSQVVWGTIEAAGRSWRRLDIKANWQ